jgi:hypothetical protein
MEPAGEEKAVIDIVVTPQFYLLKKEALPIKHLYQARRIAPSIFDGESGIDESTRYFVFRCKDVWCFIAYRPEEISEFITSKGILPERVGKLYFAEQFADVLHKPLQLNESHALISVDDTVTVIPLFLLHEEVDGNVVLQPPTEGGVTLETIRPENRRSLMLIAGIFIIFAMIWSAEGYRYAMTKKEAFKKLRVLQGKYPELQAGYTRRSLLKKYRAVDEEERTKRNVIQILSQLAFQGVDIERVEIGPKGYEALFVVKNRSAEQKLRTLAKQHDMTVKTENGHMSVEGVW